MGNTHPGVASGTGARQTITPEEQMKLHKDQMKKAMRELDRERRTLQREEAKTIMEMKKLAKQNGSQKAVKSMAKDLVRCRNYQTKYMEMRSNLNGVLMQMQTMKSQEAMARSMKGATKMMATMNKNMDAQAINRIMGEFMSEQEKQKLLQETMDETIAEAMDDDEVEEETVVNQILDEIGIDVAGLETGTTTAAGLPAGPMATTEQKSTTADSAEADFSSRLEALKR